MVSVATTSAVVAVRVRGREVALRARRRPSGRAIDGGSRRARPGRSGWPPCRSDWPRVRSWRRLRGQLRMAVDGDVDDGVEGAMDLGVAIGVEGGGHARQERRPRTAGDEHAVAEPEAGLVGVVEPVELGGDVDRGGRRGRGGGRCRGNVPVSGRSPARRSSAPTPCPGGAPRRGWASMSSICSASGMAWAIGRAVANIAASSSNGAAAMSRSRKRGAPSNRAARWARSGIMRVGPGAGRVRHHQLREANERAGSWSGSARWAAHRAQSCRSRH